MKEGRAQRGEEWEEREGEKEDLHRVPKQRNEAVDNI